MHHRKSKENKRARKQACRKGETYNYRIYWRGDSQLWKNGAGGDEICISRTMIAKDVLCDAEIRKLIAMGRNSIVRAGNHNNGFKLVIKVKLVK